MNYNHMKKDINIYLLLIYSDMIFAAIGQKPTPGDPKANLIEYVFRLGTAWTIGRPMDQIPF